jgi:hypothetical protein
LVGPTSTRALVPCQIVTISIQERTRNQRLTRVSWSHEMPVSSRNSRAAATRS